jgi:hypothetical protein
MSLQAYYNEFSQGHWADPDPKLCGCRGSGWALSDVDTWHKCPIHHKPGQRHPEDDYDDEDRRDPAQCLVVTEEKPKMPDDVTAADLEACEFAPAPPAPRPPLTDDEIPF